MIPPTIRAFYSPRSGSEESEWEDAACFDERLGLCAVADGAGSSYRAAYWSSTLVESFVATPPGIEPGLRDFSKWLEAVADDFQARSEAASDTSWYASDASRRGSFATFVGIHLRPGDPLRLRGVVVGDACLFHYRDDDLVTASTTDPKSFDSTPDLLRSSAYNGSYGGDSARYVEALVELGDTLLLTSDAFAAAVLRLARAGHHIWRHLKGIGPTGFDRLVQRLRDAGVMENDDVTMLRVSTGGLRA